MQTRIWNSSAFCQLSKAALLVPTSGSPAASGIRPRRAVACTARREVQCSTCLQWFYFSTSFYHTWHEQGNMCFAKFELLRWNWINWEPKNCFWIILRLKNAFPFTQGMTKQKTNTSWKSWNVSKEDPVV